MAKFKVTGTRGLDEVLKKLGSEGAKALTEELDKITEINSKKMVNSARGYAPRRYGFLKNSIDIYEKGEMYRDIGSDRPYAQRQEYEHATNKGYFRKALWNGREPYRKDIEDAIKRLDG